MQEEMAAPSDKLLREVVGRLLWRPEDMPDRLDSSIQQYNTKVLPFVEVKRYWIHFSFIFSLLWAVVISPL